MLELKQVFRVLFKDTHSLTMDDECFIYVVVSSSLL